MSYVTFSRLGEFGRLGNQIFQISTVYGYARKHGIEPILPPWRYAHNFVGPFNQVVLAKQPQEYHEPHFHYCEIPKMEHVDLVGYFQSEKYFEHCKEEILSMFTFKPEIVQEVSNFIDNNRRGKIPVAVQVRRTDYLSLGHYFHILSLEWYREAMSRFDDTHHFFATSDDINWCETNLHGSNITFSKFDEIRDLCLGSLCAHNIIANSSFGFFQQYLNRNETKRVIAPSKDKWFMPAANHSVDDLYYGQTNFELL